MLKLIAYFIFFLLIGCSSINKPTTYEKPYKGVITRNYTKSLLKGDTISILGIYPQREYVFYFKIVNSKNDTVFINSDYVNVNW